MSRPRPPASPAAASPAVSKFRRLANTHAAMSAGDAAMTVALADSVLFSLDADAARSKVLLFLGISFVPFLFIAPLIGPVIDRMKGGRRFVVQLVAIVRIGVSVLMAFHADDLLLFPLAFVAMVMQKTYLVSKAALVPSVVRNDEELVEANSKLGMISGLVGTAAVIPAGILQKTVGATGTLLYGGVWFVFALIHATRLPREVVAARGPESAEKVELHSPAIVLAATAMTLLRAAVGFTFFHLYFWFSRDEGFAWFGVSLGLAAVLTLAGNSVAPFVRHRIREELMLVGALVIIAVTGTVTAIIGGVIGGVLIAGSVNFSAAIGRLAFDSIIQRDAPDANQGRAFAQFETRFQLGWVFAGVLPVLLRIPGQVGFVMLGAGALLGAASYHLGGVALRRGRTPFRPTAKLKKLIMGSPQPVRRPRPSGARPAPGRSAPGRSSSARAPQGRSAHGQASQGRVQGGRQGGTARRVDPAKRQGQPPAGRDPRPPAGPREAPRPQH